MPKFPRCLLVAAAIAGVSGTPAAAQELKLTMANGRVTLVARDVPVRQILAEWARIGDTRIVNGDKLMGPPVTLELVDYPEGRALDLVLRQAAGYMAAPRAADAPGASLYDRILILPTSRPPAVTATATPPPYNRNFMPQPMPQPVEDDDREPADQGQQPPSGIVPPPGQPFPGQPPLPGAQPPAQQQPVFTAPRPGMLPPAPQQGVPNPYAPPGPRQPATPGRPPGGEGENR